jgi:hypothetical protein
MRVIFLSLALGVALSAHAQPPIQPPAGSNWQHVQALPPGTAIQVQTRTSNAKCALKSVDADSLTCIHGKDLVFQRSEIRSIKIPRRGRSALVGLAIGGGAGAGIGAAVTASKGGWFSGAGWDAIGAAILGTVGGAIGAGIGAATDFTHSTVYKAP